MAIYFISDLHLTETAPEITANLRAFLQGHGQLASAIFILGDLFEVWIGDDENTPLANEVAKAFAKLKCPVYYLHGNRDFLIGKRFLQQANMKLLKEPTVIEPFGEPILLSHGDTLCTKDIAYQKFRRKVRNRYFQWFFLHLPLWYRRRIANKYRQGSKKHTQHVAADIMDVTPHAVNDIMQQYRVKTLIHGHTHKPATHSVQLADTKGQRIVLAAWHNQGHALIYKGPQQFENIYF